MPNPHNLPRFLAAALRAFSPFTSAISSAMSMFFSNSPLKDGNFEWQGVKKVAAAARDVYALVGSPLSLQVRYPDCDHDFPTEMREKAYKLFDEVLK